MKNQQKFNKALYLAFAIILICILFTSKKQVYNAPTLNVIKDGLTYQSYEETGSLMISKDIDSTISGQTLCFWTYDSYVSAYIDGEKIYTFGEKPLFGHSPGSTYHFIEIPKNNIGKTVIISVNTVYKDKFTSNIPIAVDNQGSIILHLLLQDIGSSMIDAGILAFGFVLLIIFSITKNRNIEDRKYLYLGLASITFAAWSSSNVFLSMMIFKSPEFIYNMTYFSLFMFSLFFCCFLEYMFSEVNIKMEYWILLGSIIGINILHFCGIMDFEQTSRIYLIILLFIAMTCILKIRKKAKNVMTNMEKAATIIFIITLLAGATYYIVERQVGNVYNTIGSGFLIFQIMYIANGILSTMKSISKAKEGEMMKKFAYSDEMTGIPNRRAMENYINCERLDDLCIVSLDLNNLKYYNDNFGHQQGDALIKEAAKILKQVFGNVYRVGGDEFMAVLKKKNKNEMNLLKKSLKDITSKYNNNPNNKIVLEIACGYAFHIDSDKTYEDMSKRADKEMYKDKEVIKQKSPIKYKR